MLPEGAHGLIYYQHYTAHHTKDNSGQDNTRFAYFKSQADVVALRYSYVWPGVRFAGAHIESRAVLTLPTLEVTAGLSRVAPLPPLDRSGSAQSPGDTTLAPVLLGWHQGSWHHMTGVEIIAPTGEYSADKAVNSGRNTWQLGLLYGVSWLPGSWEASTRVRYGTNSRNTATDYRSGDEFSLEFSGGRKFGPSWSAGINGYLYRQISDDIQDGSAVNGNGNRGSVNAIGPYLSWQHSKQFSLVTKIQHEFQAHNRAQGNRLWLQARYSFQNFLGPPALQSYDLTLADLQTTTLPNAPPQLKPVAEIKNPPQPGGFFVFIDALEAASCLASRASVLGRIRLLSDLPAAFAVRLPGTCPG